MKGPINTNRQPQSRAVHKTNGRNHLHAPSRDVDAHSAQFELTFKRAMGRRQSPRRSQTATQPDQLAAKASEPKKRASQTLRLPTMTLSSYSLLPCGPLFRRSSSPIEACGENPPTHPQEIDPCPQRRVDLCSGRSRSGFGSADGVAGRTRQPLHPGA